MMTSQPAVPAGAADDSPEAATDPIGEEPDEEEKPRCLDDGAAFRNSKLVRNMAAFKDARRGRLPPSAWG